jgi:cytochrome c556
MKRSVRFVFLGLLASSSLLPATSSTAEERERGRGTSIESIMKTIHGKKGLMKTLEPMLEAKDVKWDAVKATTAKIFSLAKELPKRKPDRGTKESWAELSEVYADSAKELDQAAAKKNKADAKGAFDFLNGSCNKCHNRHKEKEGRD